MEIIDGKLYITLSGNATTGYQWTYKIEDENILSCDNFTYTPNEHESGMVGYGGIYKGLFVGKSDGTTTLTFKYQRNWEGEPADTKIITVTVENEEITKINN